MNLRFELIVSSVDGFVAMEKLIEMMKKFIENKNIISIQRFSYHLLVLWLCYFEVYNSVWASPAAGRVTKQSTNQ